MGVEGALTKDNPERAKRDGKVALMRLKGATYSQIAKATGLSITSVHRVLTDDEIRDVMETAAQRLVEFVPRVVQNYDDLLRSDKDDIKLKATKEVAEITGIRPSHTPSLIIQQIYNDNRSQSAAEQVAEYADFLAWKMQKALGNTPKLLKSNETAESLHNKNLSDVEVQDAEIIGDSDGDNFED